MNKNNVKRKNFNEGHTHKHTQTHTHTHTHTHLIKCKNIIENSVWEFLLNSILERGLNFDEVIAKKRSINNC